MGPEVITTRLNGKHTNHYTKNALTLDQQVCDLHYAVVQYTVDGIRTQTFGKVRCGWDPNPQPLN